MRLDSLLVKRGLVNTRPRAAALVMAGKVFSGEQKLDKPGLKLSLDTQLSVRERDFPWVSRGGMKLAHALQYFSIDVSGLTAADIGASTGGFTDVLLSAGAARVYAIDVGYGQIDHKLRSDPRVILLERTNARYIGKEHVPESLDVIVCDVSFIGLRTLLPASLLLTAPDALLVTLIKPQFEAGRDRVGKGGVITDARIHKEIVESLKNWISVQDGWNLLGVCESPIHGAKGNKEFLMAARYTNS